MPPRPFPLPITVGTDIVHVPRIADILRKGDRPDAFRRQLESYTRKFMTRRERDHLHDRFRNNLFKADHFSSLCNHLAGVWAAKEAVIKAYRHRKLTPKDIQILRENLEGHKSAAPYAVVYDMSIEIRLLANEVDPETVATLAGMNALSATQIVPISISHDGDYATATCIGVSRDHTHDDAFSPTLFGSRRTWTDRWSAKLHRIAAARKDAREMHARLAAMSISDQAAGLEHMATQDTDSRGDSDSSISLVEYRRSDDSGSLHGNLDAELKVQSNRTGVRHLILRGPTDTAGESESAYSPAPKVESDLRSQDIESRSSAIREFSKTDGDPEQQLYAEAGRVEDEEEISDMASWDVTDQDGRKE